MFWIMCGHLHLFSYHTRYWCRQISVRLKPATWSTSLFSKIQGVQLFIVRPSQKQREKRRGWKRRRGLGKWKRKWDRERKRVTVKDKKIECMGPSVFCITNNVINFNYPTNVVMHSLKDNMFCFCFAQLRVWC